MSTGWLDSDDTERNEILDALVCFARRQAGDPKLPRHAVQLSLLAAMEAASAKSDQAESIVPWLYWVLTRMANEVSPASAAAICDGDSADAAQKVVGFCLRRLLPALPPDQAELLERSDLGGEALAAIAVDSELPVATLTRRVSAARAELRRRFADACAGAAACGVA